MARNEMDVWWKVHQVHSWLPEGEHGEASIERFEVTEEEARFFNMQNAFTPGGATHMRGGTFTRLRTSGVLQMSDTPDEIRDHLGFIGDVARHQEPCRVLVNGLGIGMVAKAVLAQPHVIHMDVVEIDPDVIALVEPHLRKAIEEPKRLVVHCMDALKAQWPRNTRWDFVWHDIWPTITAENAPTMGTLHRKYGRRCERQNSWRRWSVKQQQREEREFTRNWPGRYRY
jgi:hypothetical protein